MRGVVTGGYTVGGLLMCIAIALLLILVILISEKVDSNEDRREEAARLQEQIREAQIRADAKQERIRARRLQQARDEMTARERQVLKDSTRRKKELEAAQAYENDQFFAKYGEFIDEL